MKLSRQIQRLASSSKGPSRSSSFLSRQASTSASSESSRNFIPDQPPHLATPGSLSHSIPRPHELQGYFDSSKPSFRVAARPSVQATQKEQDTYHELQDLVKLPSSSRTEGGSAKIWQKYQSLSPAFRRTLPIAFLQKVFQYVIPNSKHVAELSALPEYSSDQAKNLFLRTRLRYHSTLGSKWERRLRTIASDMISSSASDPKSSSGEVDPQVLIKGISKLAIVGDKAGCESIINEIRVRYDGKLTFRQLRTMYGYGLRSVSKWLKIHSYRLKVNNKSSSVNEKNQRDITEAAEVAKRLIKAMQERNVQPNSTTAENLLNISRLVISLSNDPKIVQSFNELSETILINGYSLDLDNITFGPEKVDVLKPSVKLAIIDYYGRRNKLYQMIAAFENLFPGDIDRLSLGSKSVEEMIAEEEEEIPTLSRLMAAEQKERAERGWFGRRTVEHGGIETPMSADSASSSQPRGFNDFLPSIPQPYDIIPPTSFSTDLTELSPSLSGTPSSSSQRSVHDDTDMVSSVLAMLSTAWQSKIKVSPHDTIYKDISVHVLRLAVRAANVEQARYLESIKSGTVGDIRPGMRVEVNWFRAVWRTVRWTRSSTRRGTKYAKIVLDQLEDAKVRLEQEKTIYASLLSQTNEAGEYPAEYAERVSGLSKLIGKIEGIQVELREIEEQIQANLVVATERKARSNSARIVKLEERREALLAQKSRKKGLSGRLLGMNEVGENERSWNAERAAMA
ncbi:uncharacterized protein I303_105011 [Kwoniella dejecticola CBS 10117]|uniref:Uncharacterized protein n=1 Tax=Kwoniella dejecticola CBS 10117 TaxID=1296121 RepID=A0A1A6A3Q3_9TREE|nr:uncharacterized protein I303_05543 [Kwoniella dejecticola CBS 10117]OBR84684.1 hypothetical protein I303_05543 [Kwoniella dejecticola CBS 10117]